MNLIIQGIGLVGFLFAILSFQNKSRKKILIFILFAQLTFSLHFFLLGAITGFLMNFLAFARTFLFEKREKYSWANHQFWIYLFIILFWALGLRNLESFYGILPILAMTFGSIALWNLNAKKVRILMLIPTILWLVYDFMVISIAGVLTELVILFSILIGVFRFKNKFSKNNS